MLDEESQTEIVSYVFPKKVKRKPKIVVFSSTAIGFLNQLHAIPAILGVENTKNVYNHPLNERIKAGKVHSYGNFSTVNIENLYKNKIDGVFYSLFTSEIPKMEEKMKKLGIQAIPLLDWAEIHPLGRSEWIKIFGIFLGEYEASVQAFKKIETAYLQVKNEVNSTQTRPSVMCGMLLEDIWYMPGGNSYVSKFIHDAGGVYVFQSNPSTKSIALTFEQVYRRCANTDTWINIDVPTQSQMLGLFKSYNEFSAFKTDRMYSYTSNFLKYFEESTVRPDIVLQDLSNLFQGRDTSDLYFYQKVK